MKTDQKDISNLQVLGWVLCLAALAVGARNFEIGMTYDSPIYADIARVCARTGSWFRLNSRLPEFQPWVEHPHLGIWVLAGLFKVLPSEDWAARIPGHLYYVGFLFFFFLFVRRLSNERVAALSILLLWTWYRFSNFFSSVYFDSATIFFHIATFALVEKALRTEKIRWAFLSGLTFGIAILYKGVASLPFATGFLVLAYFVPAKEKRAKLVASCAAAGMVSCLALLTVYYLSVRLSDYPDYLTHYWNRQMTKRYLQGRDFSLLIARDSWTKVWKDTNYLAPLAFLALFRWPWRLRVALPTVLLVSVVLSHFPNQMVGVQYWLAFLPWVAWLIAEGVSPWLTFRPAIWARRSAVLAVALVCALQYLPIPTHQVAFPEEVKHIRWLRSHGKTRFLESFFNPIGFPWTGSVAWYGDINLHYVDPGEPLPPPGEHGGTPELFLVNQERPADEILAAGWCVATEQMKTLYVPCEPARGR